MKLFRSVTILFTKVGSTPNGVLHENDISLDLERQLTLITAGTIISMENPEIAGNPEVYLSPKHPTRKMFRKWFLQKCNNTLFSLMLA